jgi:predicted P-loop ATPase/GTPase
LEQQKEKHNFALSSIKVGYMVSTHTIRQIIGFELLMQIWGNLNKFHNYYCDNQSAIALILNLRYHIQIYYHFLRKKVASKDVMLQYYPTEEMITDVFTKRLPKEKYHWCYATTRV